MFFLILLFQILLMDRLAEDIKFIQNIIPDVLKDIAPIIGLEDFSELETLTLAMKLLPSVLNFCLGIYARRQMIKNYYDIQQINNNSDMSRDQWATKDIYDAKSFSEVVFGTEINSSFFAYK